MVEEFLNEKIFGMTTHMENCYKINKEVHACHNKKCSREKV